MPQITRPPQVKDYCPIVKRFNALPICKVVSGTTHATAGTQTSHAHNLGRVPSIVLITPKSNGVVYVSAAADATNIYVKGSASSLQFDAYVG